MLNCRSLTNKLSQFQSFVYSSDFTIFCLTETWLSGHVSDGEIFSNDFVIYRNDRPSRGGGVLIAVKSHVHSSRLPSPPDIEVVSVKIGVDHDFVLCSVYIPPDSLVCHISSSVLYFTSLISCSNRCIFVGDFNFPDINWSSLIGSSLSSNTFCEFIFDCNLTQHVMQPTHIKGNILDLVLTTPSVTIEHISVNSDHFIISFHIPCCPHSTSNPKPLYVFDFSKANFTDICSFLLDFDFSICFQSHNIEFIWSTIRSLIFEAISSSSSSIILLSPPLPPFALLSLPQRGTKEGGSVLPQLLEGPAMVAIWSSWSGTGRSWLPWMAASWRARLSSSSCRRR